MRTPDGQECPYYYANFHRREQGKEVCRLLEQTPDAARWQATLCTTCPVPRITQANACPTMRLQARIARRLPWSKPRVYIRATCTHSGGPVKNPYIGCGHCHQPMEFIVAEPE